MYDVILLVLGCLQLLCADSVAALYVDAEVVVRFARAFYDQVRLRLHISRAIFY